MEAGRRRSSSPITLRQWVWLQNVAICTLWWRCGRSSDRSSWRWGQFHLRFKPSFYSCWWGLLLTNSYSVNLKMSEWTVIGLPVFLVVILHYKLLFTACRFTEMPTNNFIESSFWNFDSLFQPQQHPARDQHDTFFLSGTILSCSDFFFSVGHDDNYLNSFVCFQIQQWLINFPKTT